jgi:hypothetical protein
VRVRRGIVKPRPCPGGSGQYWEEQAAAGFRGVGPAGKECRIDATVSRGRLLFWGTLDTVGVILNEDKLAIDVYQYSHATRQPITLGLVERRLAELAGHRECGCGCESARPVRPFRRVPGGLGVGTVDVGDRGRLGGALTGAELSAPLNARLHRPPVREDVVSVAQVSLLPPTEAPHPQAPTKCVHETPPLPRADGPAVDRTTRLAGHRTYSGSGRLGCPRIAAPTQVALPAGWQARRARR